MEDLKLEELEKNGFPLVVKPNSGGSSVGVKIVYDKETLKPAIEEVFKWDSEVIIEKLITGEEITCSILDGKLLPVISIRHQGEFLIIRPNMMMWLPLKRWSSSLPKYRAVLIYLQ